MAALPSDLVIDITVNVQAASTPKAAFKVPIIMDGENVLTSAGGTPVIGTFSTKAEMIAAGFSTFNKAYKLAEYLLAQEPHPNSFKVAGLATGLNAVDLGEIEAADANWYAMLTTSRVAAEIAVAATWIEVTAAADHIYIAETNDTAAKAPGASVLTTLKNANHLRSGCIYRDPITKQITIKVDKAIAAAQSFTASVNGVAVGPVAFNVTHDGTMADLATAIQGAASVGTAVAQSSGALGALNDEILCTGADVMIDFTITALASTGAGVLPGWTQTETRASSKPADAAAVGLQIVKDAGTSTWAHKVLAGLTGDELTTANVTAIRNNNGNFYAKIGSGTKLMFGTMAGESAPGTPMFIDLRVLADTIKAELEASVDELLTQSEKVPYTDAGIAAVIAAMMKVEMKHVRSGALVEKRFDQTYSYPAIEDVSASDKSSRILNGVTANYQTAGGIHVVATMIVNLAA